MARKNAPFDIVAHVPSNMDSTKTQKASAAFYSEQIKRRLDESNLSPDMKLKFLNTLQDNIT